MTSEPVRDPAADHLLTPQNSALIIIDYHPLQVMLGGFDGPALARPQHHRGDAARQAL